MNKEKHCICKEWKEKYLEALQTSSDIANEYEVMVAQRRGIRCAFCDKKLIEKERTIWVSICCPPIFVDKPESVSGYTLVDKEYLIPLEKLKEKLK